MGYKIDTCRLCPLCNNRLVVVYNPATDEEWAKCVSCRYMEYYNEMDGFWRRTGF